MTEAINPENFLIVSGLYDSDASHWQSRWQRRFSLPRVMQSDWNRLDIDLWSRTLERAVRELPGAGGDSCSQFELPGHSLRRCGVERQNRGAITGSAGRS